MFNNNIELAKCLNIKQDRLNKRLIYKGII